VVDGDGRVFKPVLADRTGVHGTASQGTFQNGGTGVTPVKSGVSPVAGVTPATTGQRPVPPKEFENTLQSWLWCWIADQMLGVSASGFASELFCFQ
jgi:hypothetical protein